MTRAAAATCLLAVLLSASCPSRPGDREYFYRNYGDSWTKYVPPHDSLEQFRLSPDGRHFCYLLKRGGQVVRGHQRPA